MDHLKFQGTRREQINHDIAPSALALIRIIVRDDTILRNGRGGDALKRSRWSDETRHSHGGGR